MPHWGNHERREKPARFVPVERDPEWFTPDRFIVPGDGHFEARLDERTVLAKHSPEWMAKALEWAAEKCRPILARRIGKAGAYSFAVIESCSFEEAVSLAETEHARRAAKELAAEIESDFRRCRRVGSNEAVFFVESEQEVPAVAVQLGRVKTLMCRSDEKTIWFDSEGNRHIEKKGSLMLMEESGELRFATDESLSGENQYRTRPVL